MRALTKLMILSGLAIASSCKQPLNPADQKKWNDLQAETKSDYDLALKQVNDCDSVLYKQEDDADIDSEVAIRTAALETHEKNFRDIAASFHKKHPDAALHYRYDQIFSNKPAIWMSGKVNGKEISGSLVEQKYQLALIVK